MKLRNSYKIELNNLTFDIHIIIISFIDISKKDILNIELFHSLSIHMYVLIFKFKVVPCAISSSTDFPFSSEMTFLSFSVSASIPTDDKIFSISF